MKASQSKCLCLAAAVVAAAALSACHDSSSGSPTTPPSTDVPQNFSSFAAKAFEQPANSTPVNFDHVVLLFDVNDDPAAFNALLM